MTLRLVASDVFQLGFCSSCASRPVVSGVLKREKRKNSFCCCCCECVCCRRLLSCTNHSSSGLYSLTLTRAEVPQPSLPPQKENAGIVHSRYSRRHKLHPTDGASKKPSKKPILPVFLPTAHYSIPHLAAALLAYSVPPVFT